MPHRPYDAVRANPLAGNPLLTREDVQRAASDVYEPLVPFVSDHGARVRLGASAASSSRAAEELEGFARPLWGLAPLAAGGGSCSHWGLIRRGLVSGTDPRDPEYWGRVDSSDQRCVEMGAIGAALLLAPDELWEPLAASERERLVAWLSRVDAGPRRRNNWLFFPVLVDLGLRRVSARTEPSRVAREALAGIDACHLDGGWYADGPGGPVDWYGAFAYHVYGLLYAASGLGEPARATEFRERAGAFAPELARWFAPDGSALAFGRSLAYRFATASFWGALALADVEALPWGVVKGLYLRVLRHWSTLPIAERDGVLGVGYGYVNPRVGETYVSSCSPYWAMKAFLPLALPDDHPFWAAEERPVPSPTGPAVQRHAAMVVTGDAEQALAVCAGQPAPAFVSDGRAKYARLAYTSLGGPCLELGRDVDGHVVDATVSVVRNEERAVRESPTDAHVSRDAVTSRWEPWPGVAVETTVRGAAPWHARVHVVETSDPLLVEDWGFSLGYEREREEVTGFESDVALGRAVATSPYGCSGIVDPAGAAAAHLRRTPPNADVVHPRAVVPVLVTRLDPGRHRLTSLVFRSGPAGASAWSDPPATLLAWVEPAGAVPRTAPSFSSRALADSWRRGWRKGVRRR